MFDLAAIAIYQVGNCLKKRRSMLLRLSHMVGEGVQQTQVILRPLRLWNGDSPPNQARFPIPEHGGKKLVPGLMVKTCGQTIEWMSWTVR